MIQAWPAVRFLRSSVRNLQRNFFGGSKGLCQLWLNAVTPLYNALHLRCPLGLRGSSRLKSSGISDLSTPMTCARFCVQRRREAAIGSLLQDMEICLFFHLIRCTMSREYLTPSTHFRLSPRCLCPRTILTDALSMNLGRK